MFILSDFKQLLILFFRAQNLYCWSGQCRKNDDIVSVPYERSCTHISHHWFKCRRGGMEKRTLYHVGPGRSRISTRRLEHLLLKHRSEFCILKQGPLNIWTEHSNYQIHSRGGLKNPYSFTDNQYFLEFFLWNSFSMHIKAEGRTQIWYFSCLCRKFSELRA